MPALCRCGPVGTPAPTLLLFAPSDLAVLGHLPRQRKAYTTKNITLCMHRVMFFLIYSPSGVPLYLLKLQGSSREVVLATS